MHEPRAKKMAKKSEKDRSLLREKAFQPYMFCKRHLVITFEITKTRSWHRISLYNIIQVA